MPKPPLCTALTRAALALAIAFALNPEARAQSAPAAPLWELGALGFGVSQQAYPGSDQQVNRALVLPFFIYRGETFRADRETAGIRAIRTSQYELDIGFAGAFGANAKDIEARQGMRDLGTLIELGPRLKWQLGAGPGGGRWRAEFPLRAVFDLSDKAAHRGLAFEPELVFERQTQGWRYNASMSATLADTKLARTFYEVSAAEATALRPRYAASNGLVSWRLATSVTRSIGPDWRVFGFVRYDTVAGAANRNSPLVKQTSGATVGLGVAYTWMRSEQRAAD